jgi:hypothetical protein
LNGRDKFFEKDSKKKVLKKNAPPLQKILKKKITEIDTGYSNKFFLFKQYQKTNKFEKN